MKISDAVKEIQAKRCITASIMALFEYLIYLSITKIHLYEITTPIEAFSMLRVFMVMVCISYVLVCTITVHKDQGHSKIDIDREGAHAAINIVIWCVGIYFVLGGICTSLYMNYVDRSLFVDEAMLAYSFSRRGFGDLTSEILLYGQSAPVLWLYLCKIVVTLFGNTAFTLRCVSVGFYIGSIVLAYYTAKNYLHIKWAIIPTAYISNMIFLLRYSNMFKPYIADVFFVMLLLVCYSKFCEGRMKWGHFTIISMFFIWFSNPIVFFIGGICIYWFLYGIKERNLKKVRDCVVYGVGIGSSFIVYYFYWLREAAASGGFLRNYWEGTSFPLILKSQEDINKAFALMKSILDAINIENSWIALVVVGALLVGVFTSRNNRWVSIILWSGLITLIASYIGMFPVADRMWCFCYPLIILLLFYFVTQVIGLREGEIQRFICLALVTVLISDAGGIRTYLFRRNEVYMTNQEVGCSMAYLEEHLQADERIYVTCFASPEFEYKNGYDNTSFLGYEDNVILGSGNTRTGKMDPSKCVEDVELIDKSQKCYIVHSHETVEYISPFFETLNDKGNLELMQNVKDTRLYYYTSDKHDMRTKVLYKLVSCEEKDGTVYGEVQINNIGETILNNRFENLSLTVSDTKDYLTTEISKEIPIGEACYIQFSFKWHEKNQVFLELENKGKYAYHELGIEPICIKREE